ncbi:hypothetical protein [Solibacillus daqui]|uniref:hypothetical protein n=1 Tax=Solibacillus daqui TaxID=2912187 RepID=UPI002365CE46|nr:hypothetical protein [Solibacillus daqui]
MSALIIDSIKVENIIGTIDDYGLGGFMAKVSIKGDFLGVTFEEDFIVSKPLKSQDSLSVQFSDFINPGNTQNALLNAVKKWVQDNLFNIQKAGLSNPGKWVNM